MLFQSVRIILGVSQPGYHSFEKESLLLSEKFWSLCGLITHSTQFQKVQSSIQSSGQVGILDWSFSGLQAGETITATHILEYSDGENYDKFVFIQEITRNL